MKTMTAKERTAVIDSIYHADDNNIYGFFKDHRFLSNFHDCTIEYEGLVYRNSETAYQAAKSLDNNVRQQFTTLSANESKKLGRKIEMREDWDNIKEEVMFDILLYKFTHHSNLKELLILTGNAYLEETNYWGDRYWGADPLHNGVNKLGQILMTIRDEVLK